MRSASQHSLKALEQRAEARKIALDLNAAVGGLGLEGPPYAHVPKQPLDGAVGVARRMVAIPSGHHHPARQDSAPRAANEDGRGIGPGVVHPRRVHDPANVRPVHVDEAAFRNQAAILDGKRQSEGVLAARFDFEPERADHREPGPVGRGYRHVHGLTAFVSKTVTESPNDLSQARRLEPGGTASNA